MEGNGRRVTVAQRGSCGGDHGGRSLAQVKDETGTCCACLSCALKALADPSEYLSVKLEAVKAVEVLWKVRRNKAAWKAMCCSEEFCSQLMSSVFCALNQEPNHVSQALIDALAETVVRLLQNRETPIECRSQVLCSLCLACKSTVPRALNCHLQLMAKLLECVSCGVVNPLYQSKRLEWELTCFEEFLVDILNDCNSGLSFSSPILFLCVYVRTLSLNRIITVGDGDTIVTWEDWNSFMY